MIGSSSPSGLATRGLECLRNGMWDTGLPLLEKAFKDGTPEGGDGAIACSYLGYGQARYKGHISRGIALCERAVELASAESEIYVNLARTYLLAGDRGKAVEAVERGLARNPGDWDLEAVREELGIRQSLPFPRLDRGNPLNRLLGRLRHDRKRS